jgi:hypothetical protein
MWRDVPTRQVSTAPAGEGMRWLIVWRPRAVVSPPRCPPAAHTGSAAGVITESRGACRAARRGARAARLEHPAKVKHSQVVVVMLS